MASKQRQPKYEFGLLIQKKEDAKDPTDFKKQMRAFVAYHNQQSNKVEIETFLMAKEAKKSNDTHVVYAKLKEEKSAAHSAYFSHHTHRGCSLLNGYGWKTISSSIKDCQTTFIKHITSEDWELEECYDNDPLFFQIPNWVRNRVADVGKILNFQSMNDYSK